ncbi:hypothetical protein GC173_00325 [bacterium]|nr:hypothetical protein [bacterium]
MRASLLLALLALTSPVFADDAAVAEPTTAVAPVASTQDYPFPADIAESDPKPGKWELHYLDRVTKFRAENATLDPTKRTVVFVGDSLTEGFPTSQLFGTAPVLNRGIVSDGTAFFPGKVTLRGVVNRMGSSIIDCHPRVVFLLIGTNDLPDRGMSYEYLLGHYESIIDTTLKTYPDVTFVMTTLPPTGEKYKNHATLNPRIVEYNALLRGLAEKRGLKLIDVYSMYVDADGLLKAELTRDGLHIMKEAYGPWADEARKIMVEQGFPEAAQPDSTQ